MVPQWVNREGRFCFMPKNRGKSAIVIVNWGTSTGAASFPSRRTHKS
uniref:Uncharacterized protein n=1 Tax=Anguilla anguilla TaxID=7936 RepID=A0A0E9P757_ANGAN